MKIRHYLLLIMTILAIGFLQPLIMLIGGMTLITGVLAWIYSDLPPEKQNAWEAKLAQAMQQATAGLRKQPNPPPPVLNAQQVHKIIHPSHEELEQLKDPEQLSEPKPK
ncbi:MAG: hypothetical protein V2J55_14635 [Candidatus Competibacteraceae bacterium]|nr:hypothetical protein [Candidatus Competibacteraceae bacterium]